MQSQEKIIELLNTLHEHTMAKDIFVPLLKKMGLKGVRFTGGVEEIGIDIEYYELTQPEKTKSYVGIQFKKHDLVYSSGGAKGSVKEVKNQAEEAFEKEIHDIDGKGVHYISRFVVATTGDINENARKYIGKAQIKGTHRQIYYWPGTRLAEYIQEHWMSEFEEYFEDKITDEPEDDDFSVVDAEYIEANYEDLISKAQKVERIVGGFEWEIIKAIAKLEFQEQSRVSMVDLLMELEKTEDYCNEEFRHLMSLELMYIDEDGVMLDGNARSLSRLYDAIATELEEAGEDTSVAEAIFDEIIS
jgi:hypothetical protein